ncbi:hypothetical protein AB0346_08970 [Nocardia beijingensis]|uniref:hypothetical protein n=1 Tax=Nocardia beijingensis TaxID=95162 RepID=UPI00344CFFAC
MTDSLAGDALPGESPSVRASRDLLRRFPLFARWPFVSLLEADQPHPRPQWGTYR